MSRIGRKVWVVPGGQIPLRSSGPEPASTSRDELHVLNAGKTRAELEITIYYTDRDPVGSYRLAIEPCRLRCVRFNDLIDPAALPLDTPYAAVIRSDVPVVIQFSRLDTSREPRAALSLIPYSQR